MATIKSSDISGTNGNFIVMSYRADGESFKAWGYFDTVATARDEANQRICDPACALVHIWGWNPDGDMGDEPETFTNEEN